VVEEDKKTLHEPAVERKRRAWVAPEMTPLPVEQTATMGSTGNDGNGATTHS